MNNNNNNNNNLWNGKNGINFISFKFQISFGFFLTGALQ